MADPRGAAFFDLDKTLIEGSSAIHFGRAAYRRGDGLPPPDRERRLGEHPLPPATARTDEGTDELKQRILDAIAGQRVVDLARLGPDVLAGILPLLYRDMLDEAYAHQDAGPAGVHRHRRVAGAGRHAGARARARRRDRACAPRFATASTPAAPAGPFTYREGKARGDPRSSPPSAGSTWPSRTPTRTPSPTCRCCAPSAIRWP